MVRAEVLPTANAWSLGIGYPLTRQTRNDVLVIVIWFEEHWLLSAEWSTFQFLMRGLE